MVKKVDWKSSEASNGKDIDALSLPGTDTFCLA